MERRRTGVLWLDEASTSLVPCGSECDTADIWEPFHSHRTKDPCAWKKPQAKPTILCLLLALAAVCVRAVLLP